MMTQRPIHKYFIGALDPSPSLRPVANKLLREGHGFHDELRTYRTGRLIRSTLLVIAKRDGMRTLEDVALEAAE